jgi:hypothetical protein
MTDEHRPYIDLHRRPGEESLDLYPGLVVSDGKHSRITGSITLGPTRLPMWALISEVVRAGWHHAEDEYDAQEVGFTAEQAAEFFYNLMEHRGEFGRLILLLADVQRASTGRWHWTETKRHPRRLAEQMRRCLALLEASDA